MQFIPGDCHVKMELKDAIYLLTVGAVDAIYSTELENYCHIAMNSRGQFVYEYSTITSVIADDGASVLTVLAKNSPNASYYVEDLNQSRKDIHIISKVENITKTFRGNDTVTVAYQYRYHFGYDSDAARLFSTLIMKNKGYFRKSLLPETYKYEQLFVKYCEQQTDVSLMRKEIMYENFEAFSSNSSSTCRTIDEGNNADTKVVI